MKTRNRNQEASPKHQKQLHEKKRQNILWKQRNISNKYEVQKRIAFKNYATGSISAYNAEIEKKVGSGLLDKEKADTMKEEFSHKMGIFIRMWSEDGEKGLKEKIEELLSTKEENEPDDEVLETTTPETGGIESHDSS
ncbi:MAG: hypothetical protein KKD46_02460 [Euryarchaeota archaeon]|nr:hypothetical protein [Euryarchaeota archaeon]MCG2736448.1 hypothetical protein [Candidatus Methanoperedenaceae archaeon]MDP3105014.1 hypothetical protein [Candidatus Methanoperedens sp.]MBU4223552.1 hypothetical protein [Euryarchaeota archaeon]MBU4339774.1 hypothetical protein [Euryarchaeota archaeon]